MSIPKTIFATTIVIALFTSMAVGGKYVQTKVMEWEHNRIKKLEEDQTTEQIKSEIKARFADYDDGLLNRELQKFEDNYRKSP